MPQQRVLVRQSNMDVTIIGGGVFGLLYAYKEVRQGKKVVLYEASSRFGGLIESKKLPWGIAESAANSILTTPTVLSFLEPLGIDWVFTEEKLARYILRDGKMMRMPLYWYELAEMFLRSLFIVSDGSSQTAFDDCKRYLGSAAAEYLCGAFVTGIYGVHPSQLDLKTAFPGLVVPRGHTALSYGLSLPRKVKARMAAPRNGMEGIIHALVQYLTPRAELHLNCPISTLPPGPVVLAVPAHEAARLVPQYAPLLMQVEYASMTSVTCVTETPFLQGALGVLIPPCEKSPLLGILANSSFFPCRSIDASRYHIFTVMLKDMDEESIRAFFAPHKIISMTVSKHRHAIPIANKALAACHEIRDKVKFVGNWTGDVSLRGYIERISHE